MAARTVIVIGELAYKVVGKHVTNCPQRYEFGRKRFATRHAEDLLLIGCADRKCQAHLEVKCSDLLNFLLGE